MTTLTQPGTPSALPTNVTGSSIDSLISQGTLYAEAPPVEAVEYQQEQQLLERAAESLERLFPNTPQGTSLTSIQVSSFDVDYALYNEGDPTSFNLQYQGRLSDVLYQNIGIRRDPTTSTLSVELLSSYPDVASPSFNHTTEQGLERLAQAYGNIVDLQTSQQNTTLASPEGILAALGVSRDPEDNSWQFPPSYSSVVVETTEGDIRLGFGDEVALLNGAEMNQNTVPVAIQYVDPSGQIVAQRIFQIDLVDGRWTPRPVTQEDAYSLQESTIINEAAARIFGPMTTESGNGY